MLLLTQKLFKLIPDSYPVLCEDGWMLEVNDNETRINCTNRMCPVSNASKLDTALDLMEIDVKVAYEKALEVIVSLGLSHHMDIFNKAMDVYEGLLVFEDGELSGTCVTVLNAVIRFLQDKTPIDMHKFMNCWGLIQLGSTNSQKLFREVTSVEELYRRMDEKETWFRFYASDKLNIASSSKTIQVIEDFLLEERDIIEYTAQNFNFKEKKIGNIGITITGEVKFATRDDGTKYKPREKFSEELSDKYGINISFTKHITQTTDFLICDNENGHTKINQVKNNPSFRDVKAIRSDDFEKYLQELTNTEKTIIGFN